MAFGSGTSTSHQVQFKKLLKEIFEVCFMAWGITEDTFLYDLLIFFKVNLKAFHLLSLVLYFFKRRILTGIESEVKPSHSNPPFVSYTVSVLKALSSIFNISRISFPLERGNFICETKYSLDKNVRVSGSSVNGKPAALCFLLTV